MRLVVDNLSKEISGIEVLSDVSVEVSSGCVLGLAGVNGSGKTMLMRAMLGLISPTRGEVRIDETVVSPGAPYPCSVGFLIEAPAFLKSRTGGENLEILSQLRGTATECGIGDALEFVGLDPADRRPFKKFSLGMKQRLGIAAAILGAPDLVVLDEPTNALDSSGVDMVVRAVQRERERGAAIVLASHDGHVLRQLSDKVVHLAEGHIDTAYHEAVS